MRRLVINPARKGAAINKNIYGHFAEHLGRCIYGGIFVGASSQIPNVNGMRTDVVEALKAIKAPVLRWPGGCFADEYHWMDGIGSQAGRKNMINTHWGGVVEDNSFGTHEFFELCAQIGCDPYITGNVGSGTVREMSEWVEYITFDGVSPMAGLRRENGREAPWKLPFFGVGNENWGCGGNMCAGTYARTYRQYQTYVREYAENKIAKIACGPNSDDYEWTQTMMDNCHCRKGHKGGANFRMDGLSLHYYTYPGGRENRGSALHFDYEKYFQTLGEALRMEALIRGHSFIMDQYDPEKTVGLVVDEWGTWYDVEEGTNPGFLYQQNTMRDAIVAGVTLNTFNNHCDRVVMANIAQTVNVLQAVILTQDEKMILTPTYHVFDLYKGHQDALLLESYVEAQDILCGEYAIPDLHVSASQGGDGAIRATLVNLSPNREQAIKCGLGELNIKSAAARVLAGAMDAYNDFDAPGIVQPGPLEGITIHGGEIDFVLPACAVAEIVIDAGGSLVQGS
ncbi:MAG: alpha-N-arabinofuranosidase [Oscillospiraceae bacterium]|nr:alpha-N-arabinofuranosidase [Oscillospiraceae bacterium]